MTARLLRIGALCTALVAGAASAAAAQATQDSSLFEVAAMRARLAAARQERPAQGRAGRPDPALTRYLEGVALLSRRQYDSAVTPLRSAVTASADNARYHGDLGFALAGLERWDEAAAEYETAARLQSANPWYQVGLAAVRARQQQWPQAKAAWERAVAQDSAIIDRRLVTAVIDCMVRGRFDQELIQWARIATARYPDDPMPWLRLALMLRQQDSAAGLAAIRRFRALAPGQLIGAALYANYLLGLGQDDSSLTLAGEAADDSTLWPYTWPVYLEVGARLFQTRDFPRAALVLEEGRRYAPAARRAQFSLFLGYANAQRLGPMYADAAQKKDCAEAHVVDSLETSVRRDLVEAKAVGDSTQINQVLGGVLTQARTRINELLGHCPKP